jgi:ABC-type Na+ efflux pump permease subunit
MRERHVLLWRALAVATMGLTGSLLWLLVGCANPANAAILHSFAAHAQVAGGTTHGHYSSVTHSHKEGAVAVAASVIGIIAVVVGIVLLGSISARRRMGAKPIKGWRGPSDRGRGLFG